MYKIDYEKKIVNFVDGNMYIRFDMIKEIAEQIAIKEFTPRDKLKEDEDWKNNDDG